VYRADCAVASSDRVNDTSVKVKVKGLDPKRTVKDTKNDVVRLSVIAGFLVYVILTHQVFKCAI